MAVSFFFFSNKVGEGCQSIKAPKNTTKSQTTQKKKEKEKKRETTKKNNNLSIN
jgi:hypothetical protein